MWSKRDALADLSIASAPAAGQLAYFGDSGLGGALFVSGALLAGSVCAATVQTRASAIEGIVVGGIESFKGDLRRRTPQPVANWSGVLTADGEYGHDCVQLQPGWDRNAMPKAPSEDFVALNIWRRIGWTAGEKLSVMVWVHGGALTKGDSSPIIYDGTPFVQSGVVFVSLNYRMSRFGFLGFPELPRQNADKGQLGNYGYMEQIPALTWVRDNIVAFGDCPAQVTIFGESAGGGPF